MKLITPTCLVCGVVACAIASHIPHPQYSVGKAKVTPTHAIHHLHPELPEPGEFIREPQVTAVSTSSMPVLSNSYTPQFFSPPPPIQSTVVRPSLALLLSAPTMVNSSNPDMPTIRST